MKPEREIRRAYNLLVDDLTDIGDEREELRTMLSYMAGVLGWALDETSNPVSQAVGRQLDKRLRARAAKNN